MSRLNSYLLAAIILIGTILRMYHFFELPFTFDELSAVSRLHYNSFGELIEKGVKIDAHPAGVHVFLYYWCKLWGIREWIVKLPFALMGIGSIYITFLITKNWYNETSALVSSAFISTLQFSITYSTIARPYIPGLFFSLLMVHYWTKYIFVTSNYKNGIAYLISAAACCYIHHFCLLFAFIVGISGLFMLKRDNWKMYTLLNFSVIILYLPHLRIFLYQLRVGGVGGPDGWLGAPEDDYLFRFIRYIFNYSFLTTGVAIILPAYYFIFKRKHIDIKNKLRLYCIIWFLLPFLIGFYYSRMVNPVLQFSMLIFSFPYFIILLASFINDSRKWAVVTILILICGSNLYSLIYTRQHYKIILHQPSAEYAKYIATFQQANPGKKVYFILNNTEVPFMEYYMKKYGITFEYHIFQAKEDSPKKLYDLFKNKSFDYIVTGYVPEAYNAFLRSKFPFLIYHSEGFTYDINCFAKDSTNKTSPETFLVNKINAFDSTPALPWKFDVNMIKKDSSDKNNYVVLDSIHEWGPGFNVALNEVVSKPNSVILASIKIKPEDTTRMDAILVLQINKGDSIIHWQGNNLNEYYIAGQDWQTVYASSPLIDIIKSDNDLNKYNLAIYLWNKGKKNIAIDDFQIKTKPGNPFVYGLFEPIR